MTEPAANQQPTDKTQPAKPADQQAGQGTKTAAADAYDPTKQPAAAPQANGEAAGATEVAATDEIYRDGNGIASELSLLRDQSIALMRYAANALRNEQHEQSEPLALGFERNLPPEDKLNEALGGAQVPSEVKDEKGNVVRKVESGENGTTVITDYSTQTDGNTGVQTVNTYDADGNLISTTTTHTDAENNTLGTETTTYTTNEEGQITGSSTTILGGNGEPIGTYTSTYRYDTNGNLTGRTTQRMDAQGNPLGSEETTWGYDADGNLIGSSVAEFDNNRVSYHTENTTYKDGYVVEYTTSDVEADGNTYVSTFKPAADGSGDIVRVDEVWNTEARNNRDWRDTSDRGLLTRSTTTSHADGSTSQTFQMYDADGKVTSTQQTEVRTDGSVLMTSDGGEGGRQISSELPPGTVQSFSDSGDLAEGTKNLFNFGNGSIARGVVQVEQIGNSPDGQQQPGTDSFQRGLAVMKGMAESSTNPDANLQSVISAFGEFGREADDPRNTRPDAAAGVEKYLEIGEDASKTITDMVSAGKTLGTIGDGSQLNGMYRTQHVIGDGSTQTAIDRGRADGTDGTFQGGVKQYARYGVTFGEALEQIDRADSSNHSFGVDRTTIITSMADKGDGKVAFVSATDNIEAADDTPGDHSLKSGMDNLLWYGNGSLTEAGRYLRGTSESGTVSEGIANTRYVSDDGTFRSGATNMKDAGGDPVTGDPILGYQYFKRISDDGTFKDGVANAKLASDDGRVSSGIHALEALSPTRNMAEGGEIVKIAGGSSFDQGATNIRALSSDGTFASGSQQLGILGGGDYRQGADNLVAIGGGNPTTGVANLKEIGGGSTEKGIQTFVDLGGGDANRGVQLAKTVGENNVMDGYRTLAAAGNGDAVAGAKLLTELGHGDVAAGAHALAQLGNGDTSAGVQALARLGNGNISAGAETLARLGNGDGAAGAQAVSKLGNGDSHAGVETLAKLGNGDTAAGARILATVGGGDPAVATRALSELGKGDIAAGARLIAQFGGDPVVLAKVLAQAGNGDPVLGARNTLQMGNGDAAAGLRAMMLSRSSTEAAVTALVDKLNTAARSSDGGISVNVTVAGPNGRGGPGTGPVVEVNFSKASADTAKLLQGHISAVGGIASINDTGRGIAGSVIRSTFTYRGIGGAEISVIRMADGRILVITHRPGQRSIGFTTDGASIAGGILLTRRPLIKGALGELPEKKKVLIARRWRKFKKRKLIGVEIALALLLTSAAIAHAREEEQQDDTTDKHLAYQKQAFAILTRPTWLVRPNEDLVKLAQHLFHDGRLGFLIADLNATQIKECVIDGKRVVELKERQKIELPVWQDILEFRKTAIDSLREEDLITIVTENAIDAELIQATLAPVMGLKPTPALPPAKVPVLARKLSTAKPNPAPQTVPMQGPAWTLSEGKDPTKVAMARRAAIALVRASARFGLKDNDQGPSAGAVVTAVD